MERIFSVKQFVLNILTFICLSAITYSQINFSQNFNASTTLPSGWAASTHNITDVSSCEGYSLRMRLRSSEPGASLRTPAISPSNGGAISLSFDYKIINVSGGGATPNNFGELNVEYSINNGDTYTSLKSITTNHIPSTACKTENLSLPAGTVPNGSSVIFRFSITWANGTYYVFLDNFSAVQTTPNPPSCNATLTTPTNGAQNVSVNTTHIAWSTASGVPTGYRLTVGTTPNGTDIYNDLDVGNVNTYPIGLIYNTTYYVKIVPYNANGSATGCITQSFKTEAPITSTRPWNEGFATINATPYGWNTTGFIIATQSRLPGSDGNVIAKNLSAPATNGTFTTINVGQVAADDVLAFVYRLANFNSPYDPPAAGSGNFVVSISTDFGINYTDVQTVTNDGTAGWQEYSLDLNPYINQFVKVKITVNRFSGNYYIGFDDFYIGREITCPQPEDLYANYVSDTQAKFSWNASAGSENYNWYVYIQGQDPQTYSSVLNGTVSSNEIVISGLNPSSAYDFYVESNCGLANGLSYLSGPISFNTQCEKVSEFPFVETFELTSASLSCWQMEYVAGTINWTYQSGNMNGGAVTSAHNGARNALFGFNGYATHTTKFVSPSLNLISLNIPKLSFWYTNQSGMGIAEQNELKVYYKTSISDVWKLIPGASYTSNVSTWTNVVLTLPEPSSEYYIAFEGKNRFGYGVTLDDVQIYDELGCLDATIWNGLTWSNGLPDAQKTAVIHGNLTLTSDLETCDIRVSPVGSITVNDGFTLTVNGRILNENSADKFIIENGANLIQTSLASNKTNVGEITIRQSSQPIKRLDYTIWSSPVTGQNILAFSPETIASRIYTYEGQSGFIPVNQPESNDFIPGKGYMFRAPNNWHAITTSPYQGEFVGVPNNGNITVDVHENAYTSVGNPYASTINANTLLSENPGIFTLYFWTNTHPTNAEGSYVANNYVYYNSLGGTGISGYPYVPNGRISKGQGFIISTTQTSIQFNNSMRVDADANFFKITQAEEPLLENSEFETEGVNDVERHRFWVDFGNTAPTPTYFNQNLIGYMAGATNGYDPQIDGKMFPYSGNALFTIVEDLPDMFVIQGRAVPFTTSDRVRIGIRIVEAGEYQIKQFNQDGLFEEGQSIYVYDKDLDITHNISESPYIFYSEVGTFRDRLEFVYEADPVSCDYITTWNGTSWSNGSPIANAHAIIDAPLTIDSDLEMCKLLVTENGSVEINSNASLTVEGRITNRNSAENFIVNNDANLIQNQSIANSGEITVKRLSQPIKRLDYTIWSSPVIGQNLQEFSPETFANRIYTYNGAAGYQIVDANESFEIGKGYMFRAPNTWNPTQAIPYEGIMSGTPFNGHITINTYANSYTSIGNPYPSNIDANELFYQNPGLTNIYFWTNSSPTDENGYYTQNNYAYYNLSGGVAANANSLTPTRMITVGQGFIVSSTTSQIQLNNGMRTNDNGLFLKPETLEKQRFWLDLSDENHNYNQIMIGYVEGATNGLDAQFDAVKFGFEGTSIYSLLEDEKLIIQSKALPFEASDIVPLGFEATTAGTYSISLNRWDSSFENVSIYIKDKLIDVEHLLNESPYTFSSEAGMFNDRFEIVYVTEDNMGIDDLNINSLIVYTHEKSIHIVSPNKKISTISLFDLDGKLLKIYEAINENKFTTKSITNTSKVYLLKIELEDGSQHHRKIFLK